MYLDNFMKVKLTLNIDKMRIKKIKSYTKDEGISLSKFFEQRIDLITEDKSEEKCLSALKKI